MSQPIIDQVLADARAIVADRRRRLRGAEAVRGDGSECDPCADDSAPSARSSGRPMRSPATASGRISSAGGWRR